MERVTAARRRILLAIVACALACGPSALVAAQSTGGSFGGSHFGSSGGGGSSSYRSGNTGYRAPSYGSASRGPGSSSGSPYVLTAADRERIDRDVARQREEASIRELGRQQARERAAELARLLALPPGERTLTATWTSDDAWPVSGSVATTWAVPAPTDPRARWGALGQAPSVTPTGLRALRGPPARTTGLRVTILCLFGVLLFAGPVELRAYLRRSPPTPPKAR